MLCKLDLHGAEVTDAPRPNALALCSESRGTGRRNAGSCQAFRGKHPMMLSRRSPRCMGSRGGSRTVPGQGWSGRERSGSRLEMPMLELKLEIGPLRLKLHEQACSRREELERRACQVWKTLAHGAKDEGIQVCFPVSDSGLLGFENYNFDKQGRRSSCHLFTRANLRHELLGPSSIPTPPPVASSWRQRSGICRF